MTRTFEEMCKARDPLYAATRPDYPYFAAAVAADKAQAECLRMGMYDVARMKRKDRDAALLALAIKALRNQGQPYYDAR